MGIKTRHFTFQFTCLLSLSLLFAVSCGQKVANTYSINPEQLDSLSDMLEPNEYIPLETTEESLMSEIDIFKKIGSNYFFSDNTDAIFIFDEAGRFVNKINRNGRGHGEYVRIKDFDVRDNQLYVLSEGLLKVLVYNFEGDFLRSYDTDYSYAKLYLLDDDKFVLYADNSNNGHYNYVIYDEATRSVISKFDPFEKNVSWLFSSINSFNRVGDDCLVLKPFDYTIYELKSDSIVPFMNIDFITENRLEGDKRDIEKMADTYSFDVYKFMEGRKYDNVIMHIRSVTRVGNKIYVYYNFSQIVNFYLSSVNKSTREVKTINMSEQRSASVPVIGDEPILSGDKMISIADPFRIRKCIENRRVDNEILNNIKESDNPVLVVSKLKN